MFIIALFLTAKAWKPPKGSLTDESLEKMWSASTQWGTFQLLEKESCHVHCGWALRALCRVK